MSFRLLTQDEIQSQLGRTPQWHKENNQLTQTIAFPFYLRAVSFLNAVAHLAERQNHHPDIILTYRHLVISYSTHDAGGITQKDLDAIKEVSAMLPAYLRPSGSPALHTDNESTQQNC